MAGIHGVILGNAPALASELVLNGGFDSTSDWTQTLSEWVISGGVATYTAGTGTNIRQTIGAVGRKVIVRSRDAGVIYGEYLGNDGAIIHLRNGVQMWKWFASKGHTLIDVAAHGVKKSECKFSPSSATVTVFNACALIDVTDEAAKSIEAV